MVSVRSIHFYKLMAHSWHKWKKEEIPCISLPYIYRTEAVDLSLFSYIYLRNSDFGECQDLEQYIEKIQTSYY